MDGFSILTEYLTMTPGDGNNFMKIVNIQTGKSFFLKAPVFEIDNKVAGGETLKFQSSEKARHLLNGGEEIKLIYVFPDLNDTRLNVYLRYFAHSPFIRYRYEMVTDKEVTLTKKEGKDNIKYTGISIITGKPELTEIQFSQFMPMVHSFVPNFEKIKEGELNAGCRFPGPIVITEQESYCSLLAYEHGSDYPCTYLSFDTIYSDNILQLDIHAEKGNYHNGEKITKSFSFKSPWFHFAVYAGNKEELLKQYREFFLKYICENNESRKPYIFYNTWNYQERNNYFNGRMYLDSMNLEHIMKEIDIAHELGIDVYVIDTGWYNKTGDWIVNLERFPDGLKKVKQKLNEYGMKLGLWFNPTVAAKTSEIVLSHPEYIMSFDGNSPCYPIWETEESYGMCLASGFSDYFINKMIQLSKELGVTYFKWDGISQFGCNSPLHNHGNEENSPEERMDCYSYKMGMEMIRIVEEVTRQCPEVIVDFDVTECGRFVGLGFLSVGKYFLINNGPYAMDLDIPQKYEYKQKEAIDIDPWTNIFFYPGAARPRFCRQGTRFDSFVPSILFLTHYLPDGPEFAQNNSLATLVLGGNGIWGDLTILNKKDIQLLNDTLKKYKKVADSVTSSYPICKGAIGSSPEIYEKLDHINAKGIICFFTAAKGSYTYITEKMDISKLLQVENADEYIILPDGRLKITVSLNKDEAKIIFVS